ncbi:hypothetical protein BSPWISOXPB_7765 [uncultured Gammaproteobacteria bacterium]|nr:hypothetical protein BSPWISOXPB_7765 [uncultured Gammaproteobacteria bacterium]
MLDHIIKSDNIGAIDGSHFISGSHKITDSLEVSFINDYKITDKTNPIGFWQTVLDNHNFDYSVNFKCKFKIGDTDLYLIAFDTNKGITLHADTNLVDIDEFDDVEIDFNSFNNFKIIKTRQQIKQDKSRFWRKIIFMHIVFYALFLSSIFAYYQYKESTLGTINEHLLSLQSETIDLNSKIESMKDNAIVSGVTTSQQHIANLLHIISSVSIQRGEIDLTQSLSVITISLDDVDMIKHLAKSNNIMIKIVRNFSKNTANVSWEVRGNQ